LEIYGLSLSEFLLSFCRNKMKSTGATPFFTLGYIELVHMYKLLPKCRKYHDDIGVAYKIPKFAFYKLLITYATFSSMLPLENVG